MIEKLTEPQYRVARPDDRFHVYQFTEDGTYERIREFVSATEAVLVAKHCMDSNAASIGIIVRILVCDTGDCIAFEWKYGEGIVFPKERQS